MLTIQFSPEALMDIFQTGQTFENDDGTRLYTVIHGIPKLPIAGKGMEAGGAYLLHLDDGQPEVSYRSVTLHCAQGQGFPHDFDVYAEQAYDAYHSGLEADRLFPWHKLRPIVQAAWRAVAVRVARLTTHTLAEQAGEAARQQYPAPEYVLSQAESEAKATCEIVFVARDAHDAEPTQS